MDACFAPVLAWKNGGRAVTPMKRWRRAVDRHRRELAAGQRAESFSLYKMGNQPHGVSVCWYKNKWELSKSCTDRYHAMADLLDRLILCNGHIGKQWVVADDRCVGVS